MPIKLKLRPGWDEATMGKRDGGKPINTYDCVQKGDIWAHAGSHSWTLMKHGFKFSKNAEESTAKHWSHHFDISAGNLVFNTFPELAAYAKKKWSITAWVRDQFGGWHPDPTGQSTEHPCSVVMSRDEGRWTSFSNCDRIAVTTGGAGFQGDDVPICKFHAGVNAKRAERDRIYAEERSAEEAKRDRSRENKQAEEDACEALNEHGIKATPTRGDDGYHHGEVRVQAEDLLALAREVEQYRRILGEDALS